MLSVELVLYSISFWIVFIRAINLNIDIISDLKIRRLTATASALTNVNN